MSLKRFKTLLQCRILQFYPSFVRGEADNIAAIRNSLLTFLMNGGKKGYYLAFNH